MPKRRETDLPGTVASRTWDAYIRARDSGHLDYLRDSSKQDDYYRGEQWDEQDKQRLENQGRPALTINHILPTINTVLGEQASNRMVLKFKPARNATYEDARVLEKLAQFILEDQEFQWKESEVFADGLIRDRGYFDIRMNFDRNAYGDIDISVEDPADIVLDPDAKEYDPKTWHEVSKTRWLSVDEIEAEYGEDVADEIIGFVSANDSFDHDAWNFGSAFGDTKSGKVVVHGERERELRSVRVVERQYKQLADCKYFVTANGDYERVPEYMDEETAEWYAVERGFTVTTRRAQKIRWTVIAGDQITLHDDWSPYPWFTIVPYFPFFRRGKPFGLVKNLISPQDQVNKLSSQELHIVNGTANSGWIIEEKSLGDGLTLDDIEAHGARTGFVISYKQGRQKPEKIQPNQIPTGMDRLAFKSKEAIRDISGISAGMQGNASPYTSGRALQDQIMRSQVQIQKPLDNLARTRRIIGSRILDLIQMYYTEERVFHIGTDLEPGVTDEELVINQETAEGIVNDVTLGKYNVVITQQPVVDNYRDAQRNELLEMRQFGLMIPDHLIVKYSDLQDKDELVDILKRMAGLHEPTPEEQELAEFQRQAQIQSIQLELQKKQAQVEELMAKVDWTNAQTASEMDPNAIKNMLKIMELQLDMQKNIDNLTARLQMARMAHAAALQRTGLSANVQVRGQDMQQQTTILQSALSRPPQQENGE